MGNRTKGVGQDRARAAEIVPILVADVFHLAGLFRRRGEEIAGLAGRTQAEWQLLSAISDGARTVPQVARRLGLVRQSVQRTADNLESMSLVRFGPNPDHKKSTLVELTAAGRTALDTINAAAKAFHINVAKQLDARALVLAERFLRKMCDTLDPTTR
ncbi:MAG: MarR family winged helix-turn-helix transcriptional regulator [Gemmatimonadaceae bacterium]